MSRHCVSGILLGQKQTAGIAVVVNCDLDRAQAGADALTMISVAYNCKR